MAKKKSKPLESADSSDEDSAPDTDDSRRDGNTNTSTEQTESLVEDMVFRLPCLHDWSEEKLTSHLKNFMETKRQWNTKSSLQFGDRKCLKADSTPWWEDFTRLDQQHSSQLEVRTTRDSDTYDSWFSKSGSSAAAGLSDLSSSAPALSSHQAEVDDIDVPSIYDNVSKAPKGHRALKRERKAEKQKTLGKKWFDMKAPDVDDKVKNDMELIRMRSVLDPKRFYKHNDRKALPKYFQMGTVVDEGTDFYSSRLTKKQRKQTLVEELMADFNVRQYNKKKYAELQQKMRGKKKFKRKPEKTASV